VEGLVLAGAGAGTAIATCTGCTVGEQTGSTSGRPRR
jgi:hypothetical protein